MAFLDEEDERGDVPPEYGESPRPLAPAAKPMAIPTRIET